MSGLTERNCVPCRHGTPPLSDDRVAELLRELDGWSVEGGHHLQKDYRFKNYADTLAFVNRVGAVAEAENHHPDITFTWGKVRIQIFTHVIDGLSESDFVLAAKADQVRNV